ncbi:hypothetical protein BD410DRAFT_797208 [Rickenella mellea]|uniref:Uncharacterized protein n=1 Tax=Rickenella mellea TaxID=50990 RepID=A0A4Y7PGK0_9AGAM|nr:hypothetical protein BD410DRAFT_797208 [Rickenella mellea]
MNMDFIIRKRRRRSALDASLSLYDHPKSASNSNEVDQARVALNAEPHFYDRESLSASRPVSGSNSALPQDSQHWKSAKISGTNEQPALSVDAFLKRSAPHFILSTYARSRRKMGHMKSSLPSPLHSRRRQRRGCAYLLNSGKRKSPSAPRHNDEVLLDGLFDQRIGSPQPLKFAPRLPTSLHNLPKSKHRYFVRSKGAVATAQVSPDYVLQPSDGNIPQHPLTSWRDSYVVSNVGFSKIGKVQSPSTYRSGQPLKFCPWNVHDENRKFRYEDTRSERPAKIVERINRALPIYEPPNPSRSPPNVNLVKYTTASDHMDDVRVTPPVPLDDEEYRSNTDQTLSNADDLVYASTTPVPPEKCATDVTCPKEHSESLTLPQSNITESTDTKRTLRSLSTYFRGFLLTARAVPATQDTLVTVILLQGTEASPGFVPRQPSSNFTL